MQTIDIQTLTRKNIAQLEPYSSARDEYKGKEGIFLDANENAFGSVVEVENLKLNRYPDPYQTALKERLAEIWGISPNQIFLGNGSDEAIDLLIRAFCEPKQDHILICPPTYGMYQVSAEIQNVALQKVNLTPDFQLDTQTILQTFTPQTKLIFLCSPNNPTGNLLALHDIEIVLQNYTHGLVIIDEAYIDFCENPTLQQSLLVKYPNLVLLRTFSKAWGMAALRLGAALANSEIIQILNKIKPPYNINELTQHFALQALQSEKIARKEMFVKKIKQQKTILVDSLVKFQFIEYIYPSDANFLLVKVKNAQDLFAYLIKKQIIVRNRSNVVLCENCLRITIGTAHENAMLLQVLAQYDGVQ
ncbi:MAG: histidinol-phosphate transaminase [Microscillaceae bacterium]|nr:histidinol-phosphate transaminase [Microscillaceae bacterium]MDW8460407.1 histidinol-phosphate transaminase [Cytophagales bacterium]